MKITEEDNLLLKNMTKSEGQGRVCDGFGIIDSNITYMSLSPKSHSFILLCAKVRKVKINKELHTLPPSGGDPPETRPGALRSCD